MKRTVSELIRQQGLSPYPTILPSTLAFEALSALESSRSSAILVVENEELVGIFSEKDFVKVSLRKANPLLDEVRSMMTSKVYYVNSNFTLEQCMQVMAKVHVRHLPVLQDGRPIALLSLRHIMEALVQDKDTEIHHLLSYITGGSSVDQNVLSARLPKEVPILSTESKQEAL